ncbi:MAG: hypothetical protein IKE01_04175 [Clostridia bacterium]|nr:hypothetical protein [Clostridia bacterium]
MNKYEALIITGRLEVYFAGENELLDEVKSVQKCIVDDDLINLAISLGRLNELSNSTNENVGKLLDDLMRFCVSSNVEIEDNKNMILEEMGLSIRSYNCLARAGLKNVADLLRYNAERFYRIRNLGKVSRREIVERMEELGFDDWASKMR